MASSIGVPDYFRDISIEFLAYKVTAKTGPLIIAVEKAAIQFLPGGTPPEMEMEWECVANAIAKEIEPRVANLAAHHDRSRMCDEVTWHHLDFTANVLSQECIELRTDAHWIQRQKRG